MDYKETINLPKTSFPMKANLSQREPEYIAKWDAAKTYAMLRKRHESDKKYILHDGPPYANGHIHIGTALNKILKDIVVKIKSMDGYDAVYVPGWDCHGLPIEHEVDKSLGKNKAKLSVIEIRKLCADYAMKFVDIQRDEFKRLGILADWGNPYLTMDPGYGATIVRELGKFFEKNSIYRRRKPIYWCASCKTALAEAEVEYEDHKSLSVYVKFPLIPEKAGVLESLKGKPVSFLIWTTTPWTLPANLAIALHPDFDYAAVETGGEILIMAKELVKEVIKKMKRMDFHTRGEYKGNELEGIRCKHPLYDRESVIILGEHVTLEQGTGCVHTAPGHGAEDYDMGVKYGLDIYSPVDDEGKFTSEVEDFSGMKVFEANYLIKDKLRELGYLAFEEKISHSYPHCWRCKNPILFRATEQWFISMETNDLRKRALEEIKKVKWIPPWGENRITGMMQNRPDWCISRQRSWGVPITVFYCNSCNEVLATKESFEAVAKVFEKEGTSAWFEKDAREFLPPGTSCPKCRGESFRKENDILDVWFDSGTSHEAVLARRRDLTWPADMYLEGSDQHRGWFNSSLLIATANRSSSPYREVLTHGYVVDGEGKKMSKSAGNVIAPQEIIKKYGAEILRLWASSVDYREDIRISDEIIERLSEAYRRVRNTCKYLLGNLHDFDFDKDRVSYKEMEELDRWALHHLQKLIERVKRAFDEYEFHIFYHTFHNFCSVEMSSFYLDIIKDRLYTCKPDSRERRSAQTVLYFILNSMVKLMAPILSFTAEEVWGYIPGYSGKEESVHFSLFPKAEKEYMDEELASRWEKIILLREEVAKALETARREKIIGHSLDAQVEIKGSGESFQFFKNYEKDLAAIFIVSQVVLTEEKVTDSLSEIFRDLKVIVSEAPGEKCERCWMYSESVGQRSDHPTICARCAGNL